jgi:hypothetical protein
MENYNTARGMLLSAPLPQQTRTYKPVSHEQLMDLTLESIHQSGFVLDQESYTSAREGKVANGKFSIKNVADSEMQLQIGWQNSYDKSLSLKFAIGTKIFICANGCVSGDYGAFKKKHVGEIQTFTPQAITEYIKHAGDAFTKMQGEREIMKTIELDRRTQAELIGRMIIEEEFIESTQLNIIRGELDKPTHDYGAANSLWELYQFTTYSMKQVHPSLWMNNHIDAHSFFTETSGIITSKQEIILPVVNQLELFELV